MFYLSTYKAIKHTKVNGKRAAWLPSEGAMCYRKRVNLISNDRAVVFVNSLVLSPIYYAYR
jgi:hypothetical protein